MNPKWSPRLKLLAVLSTTKILLSKSPTEGFGIEVPQEIERDIDQMISYIFDSKSTSLPEYWSILYAPTGPIQEIAIANGWHNAYLGLSEEFDSLEYLLKQKAAEQDAAANP